MRIAILTLPLNTNYGGLLQAYALQTVLERMGHSVVVLGSEQRRCIHPLKIPFAAAWRCVRKYVKGEKIHVLEEHHFNKTYPVISQYTRPFIDKYIHHRMVERPETLREDEYDAIVVGSDQIWRKAYYPHIANAFLAFARDWKRVKRIAYAPSFGTDVWELDSQLTLRCKALLEQFDLVTVREDDGVEMCEKHLGIRPMQVLDPTMLLDAHDYIQLVEAAGKRVEQPHMLLAYVLDPSAHTQAVISLAAQEKALVPCYVSSRVEDDSAPLDERIQKPVEVWLNAFMQAGWVITDSFHACAFSIIFNKPFAVLANTTRGMSRITSLLRLFGLEDRLVASVHDINQLNDIDWHAVNQRRDELKQMCLKLLLSI